MTRPGTGEERLGLALQENKICQLTEIEPIKEALRYAMVLIGLRAQNWPADEEKLVLIQYIAHHYGGHTVEEIKLAFELALNGTLGVEVNCFENFSVAYFCSIMNAYREWARQVVPFIPKQYRPELPPAQTTDEEFIQAVLAVYRGNREWKSIPLLAYKVLEPTLALDRAAKDRIAARVAELTGEKGRRDLCRQWAVKEHFDRILQVADSVKND